MRLQIPLRRRLSSRVFARHIHTPNPPPHHPSSSTSSPTPNLDPQALLSQPTWSIHTLLPSPSTPTDPTITPALLTHLHKLSALPPPQTDSSAELASLQATLSAQLHFVRAIQGVETTGVAPLRAIRDETAQGTAEQTIGLEALKGVLGEEEVVGHARRPRRRRGLGDGREAREGGEGQTGMVRDWDPLRAAGLTAGRYFVVKTGEGKRGEGGEGEG